MIRTILIAFLAAGTAACSTTSDTLSTPQPERASDINLELGIDYYRKGNLAAAKEKIDRAVEQNPRNARAQAAAPVRGTGGFLLWHDIVGHCVAHADPDRCLPMDGDHTPARHAASQ